MQIGQHAVWHLFPGNWGEIHSDTVITTWVVMLVTLPLFAWIGASYHSARVNRRQTFIEGVINYFADLAYGSLGKQGEPYVPFFIALVTFIFFMNEFGAFPFKEPLQLPFGGSPTADLNTAAALAVLVFVLIQWSGIRKYGLGFFKHLLQPFAIMVPLNAFEELLRPTTLAARLFFNIFVGELLLFVITQIITSQVKIGGFDLSLAAAIGPFFLEIFNFLVGLLQAFVFALLSIVYLSLALADEH
ncbi:MAG: F0F1 ATP synthase subunit A [Candidatus Aquilonibacter sp.]